MSLTADPLTSVIDLKKRSEIHWARKLWHITTVAAMALIYAYTPTRVSLTILIIAGLIAIPLDFLRLKNSALNDVLVHLVKPLLRESELHRLAGTTYLITGVAIIAAIFPREIVLLTLLFLAFADPCASYFGIRYGKDKIFGHKSLQGTLAAFFVCTFICAAYFYAHNLFTDRWLVVSLLGGLIGALAELIPIGKLDDNLTLPVLSASFLWIVFSLFGALS